MAVRIRTEGNKYIAEVTPPDGQWRTPRPISLVELSAALRDIGCDRTTVINAFNDAALELYLSISDEFSQQIIAALNGECDVTSQDPFVEAWLGVALFYYDKPLALWEVLESADAINHLIPTSDEVSWALTQLQKRGWLLRQGDTYALTVDGREVIKKIAGDGAIGFKNVKRLEKWMAANPPISKQP